MPPKKSKNGRKWTTVHVALRGSQLKLIKELALEEGRSVSGYLGRLIDKYLVTTFTPATPGLRSNRPNGNRTKS